MTDWTPDFLEDDLALEVAETYLDELEDRHDRDLAAAATLEEFDDLLDDEDAAPVVYLTLAMTQAGRGPVSPTGP